MSKKRMTKTQRLRRRFILAGEQERVDSGGLAIVLRWGANAFVVTVSRIATGSREFGEDHIEILVFKGAHPFATLRAADHFIARTARKAAVDAALNALGVWT